MLIIPLFFSFFFCSDDNDRLSQTPLSRCTTVNAVPLSCSSCDMLTRVWRLLFFCQRRASSRNQSLTRVLPKQDLSCDDSEEESANLPRRSRRQRSIFLFQTLNLETPPKKTSKSQLLWCCIGFSRRILCVKYITAVCLFSLTAGRESITTAALTG